MKYKLNVFVEIIIAAAISCSAFCGMDAFAAADPDMSDIVVNEDFEKEQYISGACVRYSDTQDIYHKKAIDIYPIEEEKSAVKSFALDSDKGKISFSFDFKAKTTDHIFRMAFIDTKEKVFASVWWDQNGNVLMSKNGVEPDNLSKGASYEGIYGTQKYDTSWHNITAIMTPDGTNTTIDYYYDGAYSFTGNASAVSDCSGIFRNLYLRSTIAGYGISPGEELDYDGNEGLYIDNLKISYYNEKDTFYGMAYQEDEFIKVDFSEQFDKSFDTSQIKLFNTQSGERIDTGKVIAEGRAMYIPYIQPLITDTEYAIVMPKNFKSVTKRDFYGNAVYFISAKKQSNSWNIRHPYLFETDFEALDVGVADNIDKEDENKAWKKYINTSSLNGISCINIGAEHQNVIRYEGVSNANQLRLENGNDRWSDISDEEKVIATLDVCREENKRSVDMCVICNGIVVGQWFLDSYGNFVMLSGDDMSSDEDKQSGYSQKHIVYEAGIKAGDWNKITMQIDKTEKKITYYVDSNLAGIADWPQNAVSPSVFNGIKAKMNTNISTKDGRIIYFDNYKIGYVESAEHVKQLRLLGSDGETFAPLSQNVPVTITGARAIFSCNIDTSYLENSIITLSDGADIIDLPIEKYDDTSVSFKINQLMKKNTDYKVSIKNIKTSWNAFIPEYMCNFKTDNKGGVTVKNFEITDVNGKKINYLSDIEAGGQVYLNASIINLNDEDVKVIPMLSLYSGYVLKDIKYDKVKIASGTRQKIDSLCINVADVENVKIDAILTDEAYRPLQSICYLSNQQDINKDDWTVECNETLSADKAGKKVFVDVFLPDKTYEDIDDAKDIGTVLAYRSQMVIDDKGAVNVVFKLFDDENVEGDAVSGRYTIYFMLEDGTKYVKYVDFINPKETAMAVAAINNEVKNCTDSSVAVTNIKNIITKNKGALSIQELLYENIDMDKVAAFILNYITQNSGMSTKDTCSAIGKIVIIERILEKDISNLFLYSKELLLEDSEIKEFYNKTYVTEALQRKITKNIAEKSYDKITDFYNGLTEQFVLSAVSAPDGSNNAKAVIKAFYKDIGISEIYINNAGDNVYIAVSNKEYLSYQKLKETFDKEYEKGIGQNNVSNSDTTKSDSSGKTEVSNNIQNILTSNPPKSMAYDIFDDIEHVAWARDAIVTLAEKKIISGKDENKFYPDDNITREELVKLIISAFASESEKTEIYFKDVTSDSWSYKYIQKACKIGIVSGYSKDVFGAKDPVTRQDMAVMLYRAALYSGKEFSNSIEKTFADEEEFAPYASVAINILYNEGMVNGLDNLKFMPNANATRAQAAKMIYDLLKS